MNDVDQVAVGELVRNLRKLGVAGIRRKRIQSMIAFLQKKGSIPRDAGREEKEIVELLIQQRVAKVAVKIHKEFLVPNVREAA